MPACAEAQRSKLAAVDEAFEGSETLRRLREKSAQNASKNAKEIANKYCARQAELGIGDCGGLNMIPGECGGEGPWWGVAGVGGAAGAGGPGGGAEGYRRCSRVTRQRGARARAGLTKNGKQKTPELLQKLLGVKVPETPNVTLEELLARDFKAAEGGAAP